MQFFLDEIKFEAKTVIDWIDEDIANLKREMDKTKEIRQARIKSLEQCSQKITSVLMDQSIKINELTEILSLPEKKFESLKQKA